MKPGKWYPAAISSPALHSSAIPANPETLRWKVCQSHSNWNYNSFRCNCQKEVATWEYASLQPEQHSIPFQAHGLSEKEQLSWGNPYSQWLQKPMLCSKYAPIATKLINNSRHAIEILDNNYCPTAFIVRQDTPCNPCLNRNPCLDFLDRALQCPAELLQHDNDSMQA